jgi:hypothetical protein
MDYPRHHTLHVERELRRIGVDLERLGGLASEGEGEGSAGDFLRWLRTVPGGVGHDAFLALLEAPAAGGGPGAVGPEAPDAAAYVDPETDEMIAYLDEFDRVVPPASVRGSSYGYDWPHGRAHALGVLRRLPDGAGLGAFLTALRAAPAPGSPASGPA